MDASSGHADETLIAPDGSVHAIPNGPLPHPAFSAMPLFEALVVARTCIGKALRENMLGESWRLVHAEDARFGEWDALLPRFFMFSLKGYAYLNLRLGNYFEGRAAAEKLLELDPRDRIGAGVLLDVLDRMEDADD